MPAKTELLPPAGPGERISRNCFNAIQEGIIVTDDNGRITYLTKRRASFFGVESQDSIGKRLDERVRGLDWQSLARTRGPITRDMESFYPRTGSSIFTSFH